MPNSCLPGTSLQVQILISGTGSNAVNLAKQIQAGALGDVRLVQCISNNPAAAGIAALEVLGVPTQVLDHRAYVDREAFEADLQHKLLNQPCDLIILAGFMRILSPAFVGRFAGRIINIHPSLLPKYRGLNTHQRALAAQDPEHGVTVHLVTPDLDAGPIIGQARLKVAATDTAASLAQRVQNMEYKLYPACIALLSSGQVQLEADRVNFTLTPATDLAVAAPHIHAAGHFLWHEDQF